MDSASVEKQKISVLVPAYNEEDNVFPLLERFSDVFEEHGLDAEVVLVDDGSTDRTHERAMECRRRFPFLKVVRHRRNFGLTEALKTAFKAASGDVFVFYPADLQYDPKDMPRLIEKISEGFDLVTGWKEGDYGLKRIPSFFYNALSRSLFPVRVHDLNSIKAFRRTVADAITLRKDWHRYFVVLAAERGFRIAEVKVPLYPRKHGKSKFGLLRIPVGILDMIQVKFQMMFMKKPMLLFGTIGILLFLAGFAAGIFALYQRFVLFHAFRPLLYFVILSILAGAVFFSFGFLLEVLVTMLEKLEEISRRDSRTGAEQQDMPIPGKLERRDSRTQAERSEDEDTRSHS
jgi:glycosyltransferase involved in cell wall biosynthesis